MKHSIALVTGATSGLGHAAAHLLAGEGWHEIIVTGRSLAGAQQASAQLAAEYKTVTFTPLALDLDRPSSVQCMNQTPETAARRYLQASEFGTDVSGQFFASAQGKFSGPIEVQRQPHLYDRASQEAAWQAVVKVSGVDFSSAAPLRAQS